MKEQLGAACGLDSDTSRDDRDGRGDGKHRHIFCTDSPADTFIKFQSFLKTEIRQAVL